MPTKPAKQQSKPAQEKQQTVTKAGQATDKKPENQHPAFRNVDSEGRPCWAPLKLVMGYPYPLLGQYTTEAEAEEAVKSFRQDGHAAVVVSRKNPALVEVEGSPGTFKAYAHAVYGIKRTHYVRFDQTKEGWSLVRKPQTTRFQLVKGQPVPKE